MDEPALDLGRDIGRDRRAARRGLVLSLTRQDISHPLPSISLTAESAGDRHRSWPDVSSMFWCRSRSTRPIPIVVPDGVELAPGDIVSVPLGAREATAVVWAENPTPNPRLDNRLKDIEDKLDVPPLKPELRKFVDWVSNYTLSPRGMVLRMCLRMGEHLGPGRERIGVRLAGAPPARMTRARAAGAAMRWPTAWCAPRARRRARPASASASSTGLSTKARWKRWCCRRSRSRPRPIRIFSRRISPPAQRAAADALRETVANGGYAVTLLDGVTGSGKTEVYFEAVAETIRKQTADADPDAGDRAHRRSSSTASPRVSARGRRNGIPSCRRASARAPGARWRTAKCRSWSARARRCFCPMPISASSSSMRSTTPPTSRRTACTTTPATWRWCAGTSRKFRSCSPRRRRRSRPRSMRGAGAIGAWRCRSASAASTCRRSRRSISRAKRRRAGASSRRGSPAR